MKPNGQPIDSRIIAAWKTELSQADAIVLVNFVANITYLSVGFRKEQMPATVVLTRVCAELDKPQELTSWFRIFLQNIVLVRRIISVLSLETIRSFARTLCNALGTEMFMQRHCLMSEKMSATGPLAKSKIDLMPTLLKPKSPLPSESLLFTLGLFR